MGNRQRGVALLEVLVGFAILGLTLAAVLEASGASSRNLRLVNEQLEAASKMESLIAELGIDIPLTQGSQRGKMDDRFSYVLDVKRYAQDGSLNASSSRRLELADIHAEVQWLDAGKQKVLEVFTSRLIVPDR